MLTSPHRRVLGAASLLACLVASTATAANDSARVPSAPAVGQHLTSLAALPASAQGNGFVATGSDAMSPATLRSAREALTPGYRAAELHLDGSTLRASLVYAAEGARDGVVVERTGTVSGGTVSFAPGGVVTRRVTDGGARAFETCAPTCLTYITMTPAHQVVNGQGYNSGYGVYQVHIYIDGSALVAAERSITVPFATCSAYQCTSVTRVSATTGTTWHGFAPLGCDQQQTVHGWIEYDTGWKYSSVQVQIDNPGC